MHGFSQLLAHETATAILVQLNTQEVGALHPILAGLLAHTFDYVSVTFGMDEETALARYAAVFDPLGEAPVRVSRDAFAWFSYAGDAAQVTSERLGVAQATARVLGRLVDTNAILERTRQRAAEERSEAVSRDGRPQEGEPEDEHPRPLRDELRDGSVSWGPGQDRILELLTTDFPPLSSYTRTTISEILRRIFQQISGWCEGALADMDIDSELAQAESLAANALVIQTAASLIRVTSDASLGTSVHKELQNMMKRFYTDNNREDFIGEAWRGAPVQVAFGRTAQFLGRTNYALVKTLAFHPVDRVDGWYKVLHTSMQTNDVIDAFTVTDRLRADYIARGPNMIWELKPPLSLVEGVWQLTRYRLGFNVLATYRRNCLHTSGPANLRPGTELPPEALLPVTVRRCLIYFKQYDNLPGMIVYFPIRLNAQQVAILSALAALVARQIADALRRAADRIRQEAQQAADAASETYEDFVTGSRRVAAGLDIPFPPEESAQAFQAIAAILLFAVLVVLAVLSRRAPSGAGAVPVGLFGPGPLAAVTRTFQREYDASIVRRHQGIAISLVRRAGRRPKPSDGPDTSVTIAGMLRIEGVSTRHATELTCAAGVSTVNGLAAIAAAYSQAATAAASQLDNV